MEAVSLEDITKRIMEYLMNLVLSRKRTMWNYWNCFMKLKMARYEKGFNGIGISIMCL